MPIYIVRENEVGPCVRAAIESLNAELFDLNKRGFQVEMPEKMDFQMTVVRNWEALESTDTETGETTEKQGGYTTESSKRTSGENQEAKDTRISNGSNEHAQNTTSEQKNYGA